MNQEKDCSCPSSKVPVHPTDAAPWDFTKTPDHSTPSPDRKALDMSGRLVSPCLDNDRGLDIPVSSCYPDNDEASGFYTTMLAHDSMLSTPVSTLGRSALSPEPHRLSVAEVEKWLNKDSNNSDVKHDINMPIRDLESKAKLSAEEAMVLAKLDEINKDPINLHVDHDVDIMKSGLESKANFSAKEAMMLAKLDELGTFDEQLKVKNPSVAKVDESVKSDKQLVVRNPSVISLSLSEDASMNLSSDCSAGSTIPLLKECRGIVAQRTSKEYTDFGDGKLSSDDDEDVKHKRTKEESLSTSTPNDCIKFRIPLIVDASDYSQYKNVEKSYENHNSQPVSFGRDGTPVKSWPENKSFPESETNLSRKDIRPGIDIRPTRDSMSKGDGAIVEKQKANGKTKSHYAPKGIRGAFRSLYSPRQETV